MSESVLERLAQWHESAMAQVTVANGYYQTLSVTRPEALPLDGQSVADLTTICEIGEASRAETPTMEHLYWRQIFHAWVHLLPSAGSATHETRVIRVITDIHKQIGVALTAGKTAGGVYCDGLAYRLAPLPWMVGVSELYQCTLIDVPIEVDFAVSWTDPASQS
ncbi:MAG: hypothetical protein RBT66_07045 [bacterium]|mgnify:CR=1 FL=1|jgi:hypothetical protein|nr:hypothetical protein [Methanocellales archaeon]MDX9780777.1 hypothetical protein [bacterium]